MILIDYKDARPIYEQVVDKFKRLILTGVLGADAQMPSVRSLAVELSINPNTIQKAYSELERQGYLYTVKGKGNFVAYSDKLLNMRKQELRTELGRLTKEARELGVDREEWSGWIGELWPCAPDRRSVPVQTAGGEPGEEKGEKGFND